MLIIILSWIYISAVVYPIGLVFNNYIIRRFCPGSVPAFSFTLTCVSGLVFSTFAGTMLSLFMPLSLYANLFVAAISLFLCAVNKQLIRSSALFLKTELNSTRALAIITFIAFTFIIAYFSYEPSSHHDDGLYYSTSIKWLQEYGTVKGIANLNVRIGYNSSWQILQALFSFPFLHAGLFNDLNGLLYLYILLYSLGGLNRLIKNDWSFQAVLRTIFVIPMLAFHFGATSDLALFNMNFLGSSTSDLPVSMMLWFVVVMFLVETERGASTFKYSDILVVMYSVWIITMKLSAVPILLISIYICIQVVRAKKLLRMSELATMSIIFVVPWLARNVLLTGYLVFPFSAIDLFDVDWKVGIENARWHENAIKAYALGTDLNAPVTKHIKDWFLPWFQNQNYINQVLFITSSIATATYIVLAIGSRFWLKKQSSYTAAIFTRRFVMTNIALVGGIIFWLNMAPDFRFGYGFLCIYCSIFVASIVTYFLEHYSPYIRYPYYIFLAFLIFQYYGKVWNLKAFVRLPLAYRLPTETSVKVMNGIPITIVKHEDAWNAPLPVANEHDLNVTNCIPRGQTIKSGFKSNPK